MKKRHVCDLGCLKIKKGKLFHACKDCKHGTETPIRKSRFALGYAKMTLEQRACASKYVPQMLEEFHKGRWSSRKQAIAVGLSKARARC